MNNLMLMQTFLFILQILLIPFFRYLIKQEKDKILGACSKLILEHYTGLSDLIQHNRRLIDNLEDNVKHRRDITKIKNEIVIARITDIELYLGKTNGFRARGVHNRVEIEGNEDNSIY